MSSTDQPNQRRTTTLGGIQKTRFTPVIPQERTNSGSSVEVPSVQPKLTKRRTTTRQDREHHNIRSSIINTGPVSGPFSLGPATISKTSRGARLAQPAIIQQPGVKSEDGTPEVTAELTELQHLIPSTTYLEEVKDSNLSGKIKNSFFILQLPSLLPQVEPWYLAQRLSSVQLSNQTCPPVTPDEIENRTYSAILKEPCIDGKIGKVRIHSSGSVSITIGSLLFKVRPFSFINIRWRRVSRPLSWKILR